MIRTAEFNDVLTELPPGGKLLELGAGTGVQAAAFSRQGYDVSAIDLPTSNYAGQRSWPIVDYDGKTIPFPDGTFDIVFSSNVLEHVRDLRQMHGEIRRVLKAGGVCVHVLPTHTWRIWTSLSVLASAARTLGEARDFAGLTRAVRSAGYFFVQKRHGERGNVLSECFYFRPQWWRRSFQENGFELVADRPIELFYTGNGVLGERLQEGRRRAWAKWLGSSTHLFKLRVSQ